MKPLHPDVSIRLLEEHDAAAYSDLRLRSLVDHPETFAGNLVTERRFSLEDWARSLRPREDRWVLGAFVAGHLRGYLGSSRYKLESLRHKMGLWGLYVVPAERGQGIGKHLCIESLTRIRAVPGVTRVLLTVVSQALPAHRIYESLGFVRYGSEPEAVQVDGVFHSEHLFSLALSPAQAQHDLTASTGRCTRGDNIPSVK